MSIMSSAAASFALEYQILNYNTTDQDGYREYKSDPKSKPTVRPESFVPIPRLVENRHTRKNCEELAGDAGYTPKYQTLYKRRKGTIGFLGNFIPYMPETQPLHARLGFSTDGSGRQRLPLFQYQYWKVPAPMLPSPRVCGTPFSERKSETAVLTSSGIW